MTKKELLNTVKVFLLDLDGTVYLGGEPIGETPKTLSALRKMGKRIVFLTNNSSKTAAEYRAKLVRAKLFAEGDTVYTSALGAIAYLKERYYRKRVFLVATDAVKEEFRAAGVILTDDDPDVCLLAYDTTLTFEKIKRLDAFLKRGVPFLATHPDDVCPTSYGSMPDVGSFLAMFERSSGRKAVIIGKPRPFMGDELSRRLGVPLQTMCMVGDRMYTDIRFANNCKMKSVLVLSGETTRENMADFPDKPDLVLENFNELFSGD